VRLVLVEWIDAFGCASEWAELTDIPPDTLRCRSVGWLLHDTPECKVIVPHLSDPRHESAKPQGCGDMTIPTQAVLKIIDLCPQADPSQKENCGELLSQPIQGRARTTPAE
jgi:hypothetical protein